LPICSRCLIATSTPARLRTCPPTGRFAIAYNAALQAATAALAATGYRASRESHHHRVIQSLEFTLAPDRKLIDTFDRFRKKRNASSYDVAGSVSDKEAHEMYELAVSLRAKVEAWIRKNHRRLLS
jgi:SAV_6107-like HEPN